MEELRVFLEGWKKDCREFYVGIATKLINGELTHKELKEKLSGADYNKITSLVYTIRFEGGKDTDKVLAFLNKEADKKEADFVAKVNKYVGNVLSCRGLHTSIDFGINGIVEGENGKIKVETIVAGGYNIQRKHFRILVKKMK